MTQQQIVEELEQDARELREGMLPRTMDEAYLLTTSELIVSLTTARMGLSGWARQLEEGPPLVMDDIHRKRWANAHHSIIWNLDMIVTRCQSAIDHRIPIP